MILFPNAKINIGLRIVRRRPDGYHELQTVFLPIGLYAGTPENPVSFCDILEVSPGEDSDSYAFGGRLIDCPLEKNLVFRAVQLFREQFTKRCNTELAYRFYNIHLIKNLPDGAGLGGGSADAAFTLRMLNSINGDLFSETELEEMAVRLGADCPVFIRNGACYAEGIGEKMQKVDLGLKGWWCVVVKPSVYISTKEAFAGVVPNDNPSRFPLNKLGELPVEEWNEVAINDFEKSVFPKHPVLEEIKSHLYATGARYASMSGSGSALYGLYPDRSTADQASRTVTPYGQVRSLLL